MLTTGRLPSCSFSARMSRSCAVKPPGRGEGKIEKFYLLLCKTTFKIVGGGGKIGKIITQKSPNQLITNRII